MKKDIIRLSYEENFFRPNTDSFQIRVFKNSFIIFKCLYSLGTSKKNGWKLEYNKDYNTYRLYYWMNGIHSYFVGKEEILDFIRKNHPDDLEFFLFNISIFDGECP